MLEIIETKFPKFSNKTRGRWTRFFYAGTDWLILCEMLKEEREKIEGKILFNVFPFATGITIELFVKSIVSYEDSSFNPQNKCYRHCTTNIIKDYKNKIPVLCEISNDSHLMKLIKSYEDTIDTKFGDTAISINGDDEKKVIDTAFKIREILRVKAGFRN